MELLDSTPQQQLLRGPTLSEFARNDARVCVRSVSQFLSAQKSHTKLVWAKVVLIGLIFISPLFFLSLSEISLPGFQTTDVTQHVAPLYGEENFATILNIENYSKWSLNAPILAGTSLTTSTNSLTLSAAFQPSSKPSALSIFRPFLANLTQYPILYVLVNASKGVSYGIRFDTQSADGGILAVWNDTDALNHRQGTGQPENIQVNMLQLIRTNTGKTFDHLSRVTVYVESAPRLESTAFTFQLSKFEFLNYPLRPAQSRGLYHSVYLTLDLASSTSSLSTLRSIQVEGRLDASPGALYAIYLINGSNVYRAGTHTYDAMSPSQVYTITFSAEKLKTFPDNLPTDNPSVIIVSASGILYQFSVKSVTLNYVTRAAEASPIPPAKDPPVFYLAIFVFLPVAVSVLLYDHLRRRRSLKSIETRSSVDAPRE